MRPWNPPGRRWTSVRPALHLCVAWGAGVLAGCGSADLPASTGVVERFLVSTIDYATGDWPGADGASLPCVGLG